MHNDDSPLVNESLRELKRPFITRSSMWYVDVRQQFGELG